MSNGFGEIFNGIYEGLSQIGSAVSPAIPAVAGSLLTKEAYDRLSDIGTQSLTGVTVDGQRVPGAMEVAQRGQRESEFRPFTVTTPTGAMFTSRMGGQPRMPSFNQPGRLVTTEFEPQLQPLGQPSMMLPPGMDEREAFRQGLLGQPVGGLLPQPVGQPSMAPPQGRLLDSITPLTDELRPRVSSPYDGMGDELRSRLGLAPGEALPTGPYLEPTSYMPQPAFMEPQPTTGGLEVGMTLSPQEQAMQQQLLSGAGGFFGQAVQPTQAREQAIFERMRAAQRPEEERQRLALEERLAGQGRLGVSSAAYGGATPEMLAMATAQEEARNRSMLGAMQQAQAEQMQQAGLGQQFLGAGYIPQSQLLAAAQPGIQQQQLAQQAQQFGTGLFGETMMSGLEARLLAEQARANLLGGVGSNILAGMFTPQVNQRTGDVTSPGGLDVGSIIEGVGSGLGGLFGTIFGGGK
ncbi:hypothetical protein N9393_07480 [Luminiphilus sp.]|nr:hypothetical protein [Luminiphilus sp.]